MSMNSEIDGGDIPAHVVLRVAHEADTRTATTVEPSRSPYVTALRSVGNGGVAVVQSAALAPEPYAAVQPALPDLDEHTPDGRRPTTNVIEVPHENEI